MGWSGDVTQITLWVVFSLHTAIQVADSLKTDTVGTCSKHQSRKGVHFTHICSTYVNFLEKKETLDMRKKCNHLRVIWYTFVT